MFDKRLMYEPSIRVPMLARYPGGWKGGRVDQQNMVLNNDVAHDSGLQRHRAPRPHAAPRRQLASYSG